jgi:hypothetical protein
MLLFRSWFKSPRAGSLCKSNISTDHSGWAPPYTPLFGFDTLGGKGL